jgi:hypothetical protein
MTITDAEVEQVARAMCVELGQDPDGRVDLRPEQKRPQAGRSDRAFTPPRMAPAWTRFADEARHALAAYRAIRKVFPNG